MAASGKKTRETGELRSAVKSAVSGYLFKHTKRSPMVIRFSMTTTMPSSARIFRSRSTTAPTSPTPLPIYDKSDPLHVSGHACQEELKIIHALTTLEAKVVTMMRCLQPVKSRSKVLPTMDSLMV